MASKTTPTDSENAEVAASKSQQDALSKGLVAKMKTADTASKAAAHDQQTAKHDSAIVQKEQKDAASAARQASDDALLSQVNADTGDSSRQSEQDQELHDAQADAQAKRDEADGSAKELKRLDDEAARETAKANEQQNEVREALGGLVTADQSEYQAHLDAANGTASQASAETATGGTDKEQVEHNAKACFLMANAHKSKASAEQAQRVLQFDQALKSAEDLGTSKEVAEVLFPVRAFLKDQTQTEAVDKELDKWEKATAAYEAKAKLVHDKMEKAMQGSVGLINDLQKGQDNGLLVGSTVKSFLSAQATQTAVANKTVGKAYDAASWLHMSTQLLQKSSAAPLVAADLAAQVCQGRERACRLRAFI